MKLLMENWRNYVQEETQVLTEEELNELLQEIGAIKSMLGKMRGAQKFKGGYGWEAAVEQWEEEDALKAAQQLGMSDVNSKEDFVDKVQGKIDQAVASNDPKAKKAVQDLAKNIEQAKEPEPPEQRPADEPELPPLSDPEQDPEQEPEEEPEPEADDEKDGGFRDAMERGILKVAYALYGTREEPNALGKMMRKAEMAAQSWMAPGSPTAYTNDEKIIDILFDVNDGLNDNKATRGELTTYEINKLMKHLVKELELEGQGLSEGLISEASAWETLKYLASKAGRMEKGGKFIGRGKADAENKAKIEKQLANPATKLVGQLKKKLEDEYPDFPNNKGTTNFGLAIIEIWIAYDSIVNAVKTGKMEPVAANAIIRALYDLVDRYANYELSDVGRHFTEGQLYGPGVRDEVIQQMKKGMIDTMFYGEPNRALQFAKPYNPTPAEIEALAKSVGYNPENASAIADAFGKGASYTGPDMGMQWANANPDVTAKVVQAVEAGLPPEEAAEAVVKNQYGQPLSDKAQSILDRLDAEGAEYVKQADGSLRRSVSRVTGEPAKVSKAAAPPEIPAETVEQAEEATKKVLNELPPEELEKVVGSGATDLSTFQVANFWLTQFALPAIIYSRVAIKLLRAKGKHSSREKELKKLLSGIDVVPERTGEAEEETDVNQLARQVASIAGNDVASKLYKKLDSELKRLGYEDVLNEKNGKSQIIDLSDIEIPPDKFDEVAKLLLKSLKGVGLDINLGGKVLNAADYGPKGGGVDLSPISDYIKDVDLAMAVKKTIYQVLTDRNIPVLKVDMSENKIFARWRELVRA